MIPQRAMKLNDKIKNIRVLPITFNASGTSNLVVNPRIYNKFVV